MSEIKSTVAQKSSSSRSPWISSSEWGISVITIVSQTGSYCYQQSKGDNYCDSVHGAIKNIINQINQWNKIEKKRDKKELI